MLLTTASPGGLPLYCGAFVSVGREREREKDSTYICRRVRSAM